MVAFGKCPDCGRDIVETKVGYSCTGYKEGCKFILWKKDKFLEKFGKKMSKTLAKRLLTLKPFKIDLKKGDKPFSCNISLEKKEKGYWGYRLDFGESYDRN